MNGLPPVTTLHFVRNMSIFGKIAIYFIFDFCEMFISQKVRKPFCFVLLLTQWGKYNTYDIYHQLELENQTPQQLEPQPLIMLEQKHFTPSDCCPITVCISEM